MHRALIIDDEASAREDLRDMLAAQDAVNVVGEAGLLREARTELARADYNLVFLDVQLRGGTGFDLVPLVRAGASIVFVTGFERYAVRAFEVNALDYLVKPVAAERLSATLRKLANIASNAIEPTVASIPAGLRPDDRIFLKNDHSARFVPLTDLSAIVSRENYTDALLSDGARFFMRRTLKAWEESLPAELFVRVHRTTLVNLRHIECVADPDGEAPKLQLRGVATPITCSHRLSPELRRRLGR